MKIGRLTLRDTELWTGLIGVEKARAAWAAMPSNGERFSVPRDEGKLPVPVLIYRPKTAPGGKLPVLFNLHGGTWIGGDAMLMESFCRLLADSIPALVVNINYHKADVIPISEMSAEAADCVEYFQAHGAEYGADPERMAICGHSAGAHLAACTVLRLKEAGASMKLQVLVYPGTDLRPAGNIDWLNEAVEDLAPEEDLESKLLSPIVAREDELMTGCTAVVVVCGPDDLKPHGLAYAKKLLEAGTTVHFRTYPKALHGFLEVNRPEYGADSRVNPEQDAYARDCEQWLIRLLKAEL